jgi:hypothetical protein
MDSSLDNGLIHTYIHFFVIHTYYTQKHPDPIQTDMFMHTYVCTVQVSNRDLLRSSRIFPPLRQIGLSFIPSVLCLTCFCNLLDIHFYSFFLFLILIPLSEVVLTCFTLFIYLFCGRSTATILIQVTYIICYLLYFNFCILF